MSLVFFPVDNGFPVYCRTLSFRSASILPTHPPHQRPLLLFLPVLYSRFEERTFSRLLAVIINTFNETQSYKVHFQPRGWDFAGSTYGAPQIESCISKCPVNAPSAQLLVCIIWLKAAYLSPVGIHLDMSIVLRLCLQKPCRTERATVCPSLKQGAPPEALFPVFKSILLRQMKNQNTCFLWERYVEWSCFIAFKVVTS